MKANELRVGNIVFEPLNENKRAFKVFEVYHEEDYDKINYHNALSFEPVPITEDWLLQLGFKKLLPNIGEITQDEVDMGKLRTVVCIELYPFVFNTSNGWWLYKRHMDIAPKYIHQLQNLYFCLTGEELTIPV